jgi:integral membrane protein (TIGR00529 family)
VHLSLVHPVAAIFFSFGLLGVMLYKKVNLGVTLTLTALVLAFLGVDLPTIPMIVFETSVEPLTIAVVLATFGIMMLSQLYKHTRVIDELSESAGKIINNSKIVSSVLPAIIGFLPVAGGALMSAPLVDSQTDELGLKPEKKAYVNVWFRHTIFPVYPLSQVLVITAALTGVAIPLIILRQIPVVIVMIAVGYVISFWKVSKTKKEAARDNHKQSLDSHVWRFLIAFAPILTTIVVVIALDAAVFGLAGLGFDVFVATLLGIFVLVLISKPSLRVLAKPLRGREIYGITLAAYGAFLLRNVTVATGISEMLKTFVINGSVDVLILLTLVPAVLGFVTGSPSGGVAISVSILAGLLTFTPKTVALLFMSAYLGYLIVPSHLCFAFTADYFKCSLDKVYKYMIPSFLISFAAALFVYFLV